MNLFKISISSLLLMICVQRGLTQPALYFDNSKNKTAAYQKGYTKLIGYGKPITLVYKSSTARLPEKISRIKKIWCVIYTSPTRMPKKIPMTRYDGEWKTTYTVTDTSVKMLMFYFEVEDSNGFKPKSFNNIYDLLMSDSSGRAVRGAYQTRALSYTGIVQYRSENLDRALYDIRNELQNYPDNYQARIFYYILMIKKHNNSSQIRKKIEKEIKSIVKKNPQSEKILRFAANAYRVIGNKKKAQSLEKELIQRYPKNDVAAYHAFQKIMKEKNSSQRAARLEQFLTDFPNTSMRELALSSLAEAIIDIEDSTRFTDIGDRIMEIAETRVSENSLAGLAGIMAEKRFELSKAESYIKKAIELLKSNFKKSRPPQFTIDEWTESMKTNEARYRDILGWIYLLQGKVDLAISELKSAVKGTSQPAVYYHLAEAMKRAGNINEALVNYGFAVVFGGEIAEIANNEFEKIWNELKKDTTGKDDFLDSLALQIENDFEERVLSRRRVYKAPGFLLPDINDNWISLSDQKGTVTIICFWATWSKSSLRMLKTLQELAGEYGEDVLFLTITTDTDFGKVYNFIRKNKIDLPVLFNNNTDKEYKIKGVPTLFVIDKEGNVNFEHKGYAPTIYEIVSVEIEDLI